MTPCPDRLDSLLGASVEELSGEPISELGSHVADCPRCAEAANEILAGHATLNEALSEAPAIDAAAILARARMRPVDGAAPRTSRRRLVRRATAAAGGLAAAAIAALLLLPAPPQQLPGTPWTASAPQTALVEPSDGQRVAVLETRNPDITLVWIF